MSGRPQERTPGEETAGETLYRELLWIHEAIHKDLARVRELAREARAGEPAERIEAGVDELRTGGPLWNLRLGCLAHCRFVHHHHRLEDVALFPVLMRSEPELRPVVEKLATDHRAIADRVEEVEAAVGALTGEDGDDSPANRRRLAKALETLAAELHEHLGYEEEELARPMRELTRL